jgi:enoyl-CoA hydratase/carnithine racemase
MPTMETLGIERADGIVTITLQRPEKKNAISDVMWGELGEVFAEVSANRDDRVLILTGAGDGFCSGQDLGDPANAARFRGAGGALAAMRRVGRVALTLHEMPKPTIAAVNGIAAGAGANLALGCDLIIASDRARFSQIFVQRALNVDFGGTWLLPRLVGLHKAKELAFLGEIIDASTAASVGIVNRVVPADALLEEAHALAARLAVLPPIALSLMKRALNDSSSMSMAEALEREAVAQSVTFNSLDTAEAMAAFTEKRPASYTGE